MKYVIDVTQLVHWPGRLTGIPRVVQELAIRFPSQKKHDVVFVSWVKELQGMCEVDLFATLAIRGHGIEYIRTDSQPALIAQSAGATPLAAQASPSTIRRAKNFTKRVLRKLGLEETAVVKNIRQGMYERSLQGYKRLEVAKGDIFFIGAGEWWDPRFIQLVENYHKEGVKVVQISHDLLPIVTPQFAGHATESLSNYNQHIMPIASLVLANSQSTKRDLTEWLKSQKLPVPPIEVFRIGEDFPDIASKKPTDPSFTALHLKGGDYILCVGTIEARKNHAILYYTYKLAKERGIELPKLIIAGRRGWKTDDIYEYFTQDPETKDAILPMHDVSDEELTWLYDHCLFSIYPSFYEGWGMPVAESIMRGVPAIASNTSSIAEVAPDHAVYFHPASTDELLNAIISLLKPGALEKKRQQVKTYKPTSWDDSFQQVLNYVEKL